MPQIVEFKDSEIEFPDSMSADQIAAKMQELFPTPRQQRKQALLTEQAAESRISERAQRLYNIFAAGEQITEPYTAAGMLNQPARLTGQPDPYQPGVGVVPPEVAGAVAELSPAYQLLRLTRPEKGGVAEGLRTLAGRTLSGFTTPESIVTLPAAAGPGTGPSLVRTAFATEMGRHLPEQVQHAAQVLQSPTATPAEKVVVVGEPAIAAAMIGGIAKHAYTRPTLVPRQELQRTPFPPEATPEEAALFAQEFRTPKEPVVQEQAPPPTETPKATVVELDDFRALIKKSAEAPTPKTPEELADLVVKALAENLPKKGETPGKLLLMEFGIPKSDVMPLTEAEVLSELRAIAQNPEGWGITPGTYKANQLEYLLKQANEVKTAAAETPATAPQPITTPEAISVHPEPLRIEALGLSEADLTPGKIKLMPANNPEQWATVKKYFGVKGVKEAQGKIAARFEQMREAAQPKKPSEAQIQEAQEAILPEPKKPSKRKSPMISKAVERPWDIIDEIKSSIGTIRTKLNAKPGSEGYYSDAYRTATKRGGRELFSKTGQSPDEIVDTLRRNGIFGEDATVDDLWDAINSASSARRAYYMGELPEQKAVKFGNAIDRAFKSKSKQLVSVGDLSIGDKFRIAGEEFEVVHIDADTGEVTVRDGRKFGSQTIPDGADIPADKGSVELKPSSAEFLPEQTVAPLPKLRQMEKQGDLMASQTEPFALAGEKGIDIERIQAEQKALEAKKKLGESGTLELPGTSIGPGAASPAEFAEIRAEADRGIFTRLTDWIKSRRTPDNPNIAEAVKQRDVMAGRQWINSPEYLFRKDPVAAPLVSRIVEAQLRHNNRASKDEIHFQEITKGFDEPSMKRITSALRMQEAGESNPFAILRPEERAVAQEIRNYFDGWKERLRTQKAQKIIDALPDARRRTIEAIQGGQSFEAAAKANKLRAAGKEGVRLALKEIEEARKWGIENYVTHAEQGPWRIVTEDGTTVALGETKSEAYQKAEAYLAENPGTGKLTLDDSFDPGFDWPSQLTPPAYGKLLDNLNRATGATAQELQQALRKTAPGIVVKPTNKYTRFLTKRYGVLKGEENINNILPSYIYSMWKKQELDPVLKEARATMPKLGNESRQAVEALLADVKGQKYLGDKIVDHVLSGASDLVEKTTGFSLPVRPFGFSRGVNVLRNISAHLKLGYRPISVLINRLGGIQHTWTKTGFADFLEGRKWMKTEEGRRLVKENEAEMGLTAAFVTEGKLSREEPWYKPLGLFQKMEHFNRPEAFGAFYIQGTKRLGLTGEQAVQYARNATRFAQFTYNTAALPKIMRGPTGRLLFQFKPYLVKELEFISSLRGAEIGRYLTGFLAMGGPRAAIIVLKSLPILGAIGAIRELEDWMNRKAPKTSRGVAGLAGADISAAAAPQLPSTVGDWVGPVLNDYVRLWNEIISPALKGESKDWSNIKNWAVRTAPALFYMNQAVESILGEQGWVTDHRGRHQFQPSKWDKAKLMLGVTPLDKSIQQSEQRYLLETESIQKKNRQHWLDNVADALEQNNDKRLNALLEDVGQFYASHEDFVQAIKNNIQQRAAEPRARLFKRLSKVTRIQESERFSE